MTTLHRRIPRLISNSPAAHLPGLLLTLLLAACAIEMGRWPWFASHGLGPLVLAMVLGMLVGNSIYPALKARSQVGVAWSQKTLLRAGIVLYGLQLTLGDIAQLGWTGVLVDALILSSTFALALWVGTRWLGLDRGTVVLIGAGSSICGAAAVLATEPVARARPEQVAVAVATVVVFGTLAVLVYPLLHQWMQLYWAPSANGHTPLDLLFGRYIGSTVHEVAQVVATAQGLGADVADQAVIAKLVRVLMLAPFLLVLSWCLSRRPHAAAAGGAPAAQPGRQSITIPWFAVGFMAVVALHSLVSLPAPALAAARQLDSLLLTMAMAALGLGIHHDALRRAGVKPLLLATILFVWLVLGGGLLNWLAWRLF